MEPNKIEKQFKEQLNFREIKPSEKAWDKLDAMLTAAEKPKRNFRWFYVAASIFGFLLVGTVYFNRFETVEINNDKPTVLEEKGNVNNLDGSKIVNKGVLNGQIQKKVTKTQTVVAYSNDQNKQLNQLKNKEELSIINHLKEDSVIVNSSENKNYQSTTANKYISAEKLLAEVSDAKFETKATDETIEKKRKAISVNPNDLLLNAETELNQSFRESALDRFNKKFNAVKTVLVNRNYEE
ncbi:hypothetical protein CLU83_2782 [Flavobacterium sp. 1]|uniref:hypothetical protein n=1 Tax=Flavobacterium sp. 1 TaxID=2035200 RepID=UPI000C236B2F|nr:hypothetical protein [Flavobacterium sp. 1]PJJ09426.1 hypothetical protein CLU83_2782 [Flavobacterium sp. 1]